MVYSGKTVVEGKRKVHPLPRMRKKKSSVVQRRQIALSRARIRRAGRVGTGTEGAYSGSKTIPRHKKGGGKVWKGEGKYRDRNLTSPQAMQGLQVRVKRPRKIGMPRPRPVMRPRPAGGQAMISGMARPPTKPRKTQYKQKPRTPKPRTTTKPSY